MTIDDIYLKQWREDNDNALRQAKREARLTAEYGAPLDPSVREFQCGYPELNEEYGPELPRYQHRRGELMLFGSNGQ